MYAIVGLLLFGIFGIVAVTIDFGLVTLTRVQMQNAVDSAALEGLRQRDALGDLGRRQAAADLLAQTFDDDLNPANGDPRNFGAGPDLQTTGGLAGATNASAQLVISDPPVYKPSPQLNATNEMHGDMVSGAYAAATSPDESNDYGRNDFTPVEAGASATAPSFLVRMRRTNDPQGLDNIDGVSSAGRALPLLFGHASVVNGPVRANGFTVRATAIAAFRNARIVRVGTAIPERGIPGVTSFALERSFYGTLVPGVATPATVDSGIINLGGVGAVGRFVAPARVIGEALASMSVPPTPVLSGYTPVFQNLAGLDRVIGFARVSMLGGPVGPVSIVRETVQSAELNATDHLGDPPAGIPAGDWVSVQMANQEFFVESLSGGGESSKS